MERVAILTGGGDCPGLNPAIRAIVRRGSQLGYEVVGFRKGWKGAIRNETVPVPLDGIDDLLIKGGTIIGTSRTNPLKEKDGIAAVRASLKASSVSALIAIGGEDTLGAGSKLVAEGLPIVGLPKTIDNDLDVTQFTLGFPTAVEIVSEALDRLRTTAESHERIMVCEIMGRHAGWLTALGGIAGGADVVIVPEHPMKLTEVCDIIESCRKRGKKYAIIAVAEGAEIIDEKGNKVSIQSDKPVDSFGHVQLGGIGDALKDMIKAKTGYDTRATNLGHTQRGGTPSAFDRIISTAFGVHAMNLVHQKAFGKMPALVGGKIVTVPMSEAVGKLKTLSDDVYQLAQVFFG